MIWLKTADGITESGFFRIHRLARHYEIWMTAPKCFHLLSKTETLHGAKAIAMEWARAHEL